MACMEHWCVTCGAQEFNNSVSPQDCPKCGAVMNAAYDDADVDDDHEIIEDVATEEC